MSLPVLDYETRHWLVQRNKQAAMNESILNTIRQRQYGRHFAEDIFKYIILNENVWMLIQVLLNFIPKGPINNIPALSQIMAWRPIGDKPLYETMLTRFTDAFMQH